MATKSAPITEKGEIILFVDTDEVPYVAFDGDDQKPRTDDEIVTRMGLYDDLEKVLVTNPATMQMRDITEQLEDAYIRSNEYFIADHDVIQPCFEDLRGYGANEPTYAEQNRLLPSQMGVKTIGWGV